ncbi:DUF362 domain-containing protein [Halorubrum sp. CBA1125]|uniref:DUF362 domain-containing protein n=1 Tax=Halorubrum sp. CBA1125 TaxID=2668072 RepID=UPI0012E742EB|nr:DUF362 domain-containing protein [Halorubrum sp. CBA1125]MUW15249.1 DUF362 domain-containing protein [Halorubrum sp. CBA1125]
MSNDHDATVAPVPEEMVLEACGDVSFPEMGVIEQLWETDPIPDDAVADAAAAALDALSLTDVPAGGEVALGVGSRGIANLAAIVSGVVSGVHERGYEPFVFPAMGSHGGATGEGQRKKLEALGINEETIGCEIRSSMEVVEVGRTPERDVPVVADANAAAADAIVPINRVKPHTDFQGEVESGLSKMLVIGMGKQRGAKIAHERSVGWSLSRMIPEISTLLREELPVVGGIAIVEDQYDDTALIEGVPPDGFLDREAALLERAYELMPTLPFEDLDALVLDAHGKEISGAGMDTNVVGRMEFAFWEPEPEKPDVKRIYVRSLTEPSMGNGIGVGQADVAHADFFDSMDLSKALINGITSSAIRSARIPPIVETDRAGLATMLSTIGVVDPDTVRVLRVTDTMHLKRVYASRALVEEARERDDLRVVSEPGPIEFDEDGNFAAPSPTAKND